MKVLTALDRSEYAEIVLEHGLDQAARGAATELHFVTVIEDGADADGARAWLQAIVRDGLDAFGLRDRAIELHVRRGRPAAEISMLAQDVKPDLLVIGRFAVPSESDAVIDTVDCPTLVVGIEGHVLEPQCDACKAVRHASRGERLFCDRHISDRVPDLASRLPPSTQIGSRMW
jgi:nucleotide-binding universal stress UspA family protein